MHMSIACRGLMALLSLALLAGDIARAQNPVGIFDSHTDVGRPRQSGSVAYDPQHQAYVVAGSGQNMWGDRDDFHFVWKRLTGNFILSTRARFIGKGVDPHRKLGWTIRPSLETSEDLLVNSLSEHGAVQLRIDVSKTRQQARLDELERLVSAEADADITATIVELSQATTAYEAALASSADILKLSLLDYLR